MPRRFSSLFIVVLMVSSALAVLASSGWTPQGYPESPHGSLRAHILTGTDNTWISDGASYSGISTSWQNGSLTTGQNIWFLSSHVGSCTWNNSLGVTSFGSLDIRAGYTGTITQAASFSVTSYSQAAGTFTPVHTYTFTIAGSLIKTGGTWSGDSALILTGEGATLTTSADLYSYSLRASANITLAGTKIFWVQGLTVDAGKTITNNAASLRNQQSAGASFFFTNNGIITGSGNMDFEFYNAVKTVTFGTINCPAHIYLNSAGLASKTLTLGANANFGGTLTIDSSHASNTMTLDLSSSNYALSATDITIHTRGILNGRGSVITCSGSFDDSATGASFIPGTSSLRLTGTSKTLKSDGTSGFNKLFLDVGSSYTLSSNIHTQQYWKNGTLTTGAYTLYVDQDQAPSITSTPTGTTFSCASPFSYAYAGHDREGESLTYGLSTNLSGFTLSTGNSTIWRHGANHARGTFFMNLSCTDGNHTVWQNTTLTVSNDAPVFMSTPILSIEWNVAYSYDANATDADGTLTYGLSSSLGGLNINSTTGVVSKAVVNANGSFTVDISASDGNYTSWQNYSVSIINQYPVVTSRPRMSLLIYEVYSYLPVGNDPEGHTITVNVTFNAPWLTLDPNGTISGSPLKRDTGVWLVNVSFWDGYRTTWGNFTIEVSILPVDTMTILNIILGVIFGFCMIGISLIDKERRRWWSTFTGFSWLAISVVVFFQLSVLWFAIGVGIGLVLMLTGAKEYAAGREK